MENLTSGTLIIFRDLPNARPSSGRPSLYSFCKTMEDYTTQKLNELLKCLDQYIKLLLDIERIMQPIHQLEFSDEEEHNCCN